MTNQENIAVQEQTTRTVTFNGNLIHLAGNEVKIGEPAPDFIAVDHDLKGVRLSDLKGQIVVLVSIPSLDTPVCDLETRKFNQKAAQMGENVKIVIVSMDLPFAQKRWCGANDVKNLITLSDYQKSSFGQAFGALTQELHLLTRAVFVIDRDGILQYKQFVDEISNEPNYDQVLQTVEKLVSKQGT